jgi:hypothetical protein
MDKVNTHDWTHKDVRITDIRKLNNKFYIISINDPNLKEQIKQPLFVKEVILKERLKTFFLKDAYKVTREEILSVPWNLYLTQGHYVKLDENGNIIKFDKDPNKWYISFLEISGPLGGFSSVYRDKELNKLEK